MEPSGGNGGAANLGVAEVASRIFGPGISVALPGPDAEAAATDVAEAAFGAAALQRAVRTAEAVEQRVVAARPNAAEGFRLHIAQRVRLPELVRMNRSLSVNVRKAGFLINVTQMPERGDGLVKCSRAAAKLVVGFPDAVEGDTDIGETERLEPGGFCRIIMAGWVGKKFRRRARAAGRDKAALRRASRRSGHRRGPATRRRGCEIRNGRICL